MYDSSDSCNPGGNRWGFGWIFDRIVFAVPRGLRADQQKPRTQKAQGGTPAQSTVRAGEAQRDFRRADK